MEKELGLSESPKEFDLVISQLRTEHAELARLLEDLDSRPFLTPSEQIERKRLQKLKLAKKDQIQIMLAEKGTEE